MTSPTTPRNTLSEIMLVARSKTDFVFIFFILGTFLVLKGGWGTPKVGLVQKTIGKVIGRCVGNLGNIVCTSNPNNGQGHQNAQGLAAMRCACVGGGGGWPPWPPRPPREPHDMGSRTAPHPHHATHCAAYMPCLPRHHSGSRGRRGTPIPSRCVPPVNRT